MPTSTPSPGPGHRPGHRSGRRHARRAVVLVLALATVAATAACSAPDAPPPVASLPTTPAATPSDTAPPATAPSGAAQGATDAPATPDDQATTPGGHPQFRLDDTDERRTALINAYSQCLLDNGATKDESRGARADAAAGDVGGSSTPLIVVADPVPAEASAACADVLPLMPPEVEAATNPDFRDQSMAYVACMKDQGLWVQLLNNSDLSWTYVDDHPVPENSEQIEHDCLIEAFS